MSGLYLDKYKNFSEFIYKGNYRHPLYINFEEGDAYIILTGKGGDRHIIIGDNNGDINIWFNTHLYENKKYMAELMPYIITGKPSDKLTNLVCDLIKQTIEVHWSGKKWTEDGLNKFFAELYSFTENFKEEIA